MKKRIVLLRSNSVNPDSRVEKEVNALAKNGFDIVVLAWDRTSNYKEKKEKLQLKETEVDIYRRGLAASFGEGFKNIIPFIKFQLFLISWLITNKEEYDIIHACDFDTGFAANLTRAFTKKKLVFDIFDYLSTDANSFFRKLIKKLEDNIINKANATIICTEQRKQQIVNTNPKEVIVIHNTPQTVDNEATNNHDNIRIAYIGILQDFRLILEMINVIKEMKNIELHIGGFGKLEKEVVKIANNNSNIFYYGKLSYDETLKLENNCDIMTAIYDPQIGNHKFAAPNKFYEALMLGKPLIMVKNTGMSEIVRDNNIGVLIDYSSDGFKEGLIKLISKKNEWKHMSSTMKNLYKEKYSWEVMEKRLIDLYENI